MNWPMIAATTVSAVLVDIQAYNLALNEYYKQVDLSNPPKPRFRFDLFITRAVIGFMTGAIGGNLQTPGA